MTIVSHAGTTERSRARRKHPLRGILMPGFQTNDAVHVALPAHPKGRTT
jgi:hypothetical protein